MMDIMDAFAELFETADIRFLIFINEIILSIILRYREPITYGKK